MNSTLILAMTLAALPPAQLHPLGHLHGDETVARDGERWLALQVDGTGARLEPVVVRVAPVHDSLIDRPGETTGRDVSVVAGGSPRLLLSGAELQPGPLVQAVPESELGYLLSESGVQRQPLYLALPGQPTASLSVHCDESDGPGPVCRLWLQQDRLEQVLATYPAATWDTESLSIDGDVPLSLLFAGDLDRDGRLDLILDLGDHYNVAEPTLLLSGAAGPGELLRAVAAHRSTGC